MLSSWDLMWNHKVRAVACYMYVSCIGLNYQVSNCIFSLSAICPTNLGQLEKQGIGIGNKNLNLHSRLNGQRWLRTHDYIFLMDRTRTTRDSWYSNLVHQYNQNNWNQLSQQSKWKSSLRATEWNSYCMVTRTSPQDVDGYPLSQ